MNVTKASGEIVPFDAGKIRRSLRRVKANPALIEQVVEAALREAYDGIPTSELYRIVFGKLKKMPRGVAGKYNLKRAIMALGPTGFPFEKFVAALWRAEGFATSTGQVMTGFCVNHEVDVIAEKDGLYYMMECKFHGLVGGVCDLKTALYVYARFLDLEKTRGNLAARRDKIFKGWLVTNMRFTTDALTYGTCAGLELLSWDFPAGASLRERIDSSGLHPITCLTTLTGREKKLLLEKTIVLTRDLCDRPQVLREIGLRGTRVGQAIDEARAICQTPNSPA